MRIELPVLLFAVSSAVACGGNCGSPQLLNGGAFTMRGNQVELVDADGLDEFTAGPDFLSYGVPVNGLSSWTFDWGTATTGPVTVTVDGQPFQGEGYWDLVECGYLEVKFAGKYVDEAETSHAFDTFVQLVYSDETLRGEAAWNEAWSTPDGLAGSYKAVHALDGGR